MADFKEVGLSVKAHQPTEHDEEFIAGLDEKNLNTARHELGSSVASDDLSRNHDTALDFLRAHSAIVADPSLYTNDERMRRLRRKVDLCVMPFLIVAYSLNFTDKVLLNYSNVMGLSQSLHLKGNEFSNAASAFFIAVLCAMIPNIYLLQRLPVARWLGTTLTIWGICTACHAALRNYDGLLTLRILCGIFEAAVPSALMLLSSQYYTRKEQSVRFAYWYTGLGIGQIVGGLISFAFQHVKPDAPLAGWRIMFLVLGLFTVLVGISIFFFVPNTPMEAWFLTDDEKVNLLEHVRINQTGIDGKHFQPGQILEALIDPGFLIVFFIVLLQGTGGGAITSYSATLLHSFGYTAEQAALLNMPSGVLNILSTFFCGLLSRYHSNRWLWTFLVSMLGVTGAALMSFLPPHARAGHLAGIYLANCIVGATPTDYQWITANTAGHTKRAFVVAMMNAAFAVGNIIGPETFRAKDRPLYRPATTTLVATWAASGLLALVLGAWYVGVNRARDRKYGKVARRGVDGYDATSESKAFAGLTDKQNTDFRYVY